MSHYDPEEMDWARFVERDAAIENQVKRVLYWWDVSHSEGIIDGRETCHLVAAIDELRKMVGYKGEYGNN